MKKKKSCLSLLAAFSLIVTCTACQSKDAGSNTAEENSALDQVQLEDNIIASDANMKDTIQELTKDQLYYKCLNTILYKDKLSGETNIRYRADSKDTVSGSFQFDYIKGIYHSEFTFTLDDGSVYSETEKFNNSTEMVELYNYPEKEKKDYMVFTDGMCPSIDRTYFVDRCPVNPKDEVAVANAKATNKKYYTSIDQISETELMQIGVSDPSGAGAIAGSFCPTEMTLGYLKNFDNWEITGTKEYQGRNCTVVQGISEKDYGNKMGVDNFEILVDTETGVWMQYEGYDAYGNVVSYVYTKNLCFGDNAEDVPLFSKNMANGYTLQTVQ